MIFFARLCKDDVIKIGSTDDHPGRLLSKLKVEFGPVRQVTWLYDDAESRPNEGTWRTLDRRFNFSRRFDHLYVTKYVSNKGVIRGGIHRADPELLEFLATLDPATATRSTAAASAWWLNKPGSRARLREIARPRIERMKCRRPDMPAFTRKDWRIALEFFDNRCAYCGSAGPLQRDHFIPLRPYSGFHTADNIVPACGPCNLRKRDHFPTEETCGGLDAYQRIVEFLYSRFLALSRDPKTADCGIRRLRESIRKRSRTARKAQTGQLG